MKRKNKNWVKLHGNDNRVFYLNFDYIESMFKDEKTKLTKIILDKYYNQRIYMVKESPKKIMRKMGFARGKS